MGILSEQDVEDALSTMPRGSDAVSASGTWAGTN